METETLVDVAVGITVVIEGTSVMEIVVDTLTTALAMVEAVTVVVGVARDRQPQAEEINEQAKWTGAPGQVPVAEEVVDVVAVVVVFVVVVVVVEADEPAEQD